MPLSIIKHALFSSVTQKTQPGYAFLLCFL